MLTDAIINEFRNFAGDEDNALWGQGDLLKAHALTKDEINQLARILQYSPAKLLKRQLVSTETPKDKRVDGYSWNLYAVFTKIADQDQRWNIMFDRDNWTLVEAKEVVKAFTAPSAATSEQKTIGIQRAELRVGKIHVKAKLDPMGNLTLLVNLGGNRVCEVTPQSVNTKIVFPA